MKKLIASFLLLFAVSSPAYAASSCPNLYPNGKEIVVPNTVELCSEFFVTVFDVKNNGTVFSSEIATPRTNKVVRKNDFRADKRVPGGPTPDDYTNSGYDRGHMTPAADSNSDKQMSETFLMTNMTPQLPSVNRVAWRMLEDRVRSVPFTYVITGAVYQWPAKTIGKNKVPVPVALYKIAYFASGNKAIYFVDNIDKATVRTIGETELEAKVGFDLP
jgi:endonuclease G